MDVLGHRFLVVPRFGLRRIAKAAQVGRHHEVALRQLLHERTPHVAVLRVAMEQDDRGSFSCNEIVQLHTISNRIALRDHRCRLGVDIRGDAKYAQEQYRYRYPGKMTFHRHGVPFRHGYERTTSTSAMNMQSYLE